MVKNTPLRTTCPRRISSCCGWRGARRTSVGAATLARARFVCEGETEAGRQTESGTRHSAHLKTHFPKCYLPLLCRCHGYSALSPRLSVGKEGSEERGSGSGCCLCVIFIPVQPERCPPPSSPRPLPPPPSSSSSSSSNFFLLVTLICSAAHHSLFSLSLPPSLCVCAVASLRVVG